MTAVAIEGRAELESVTSCDLCSANDFEHRATFPEYLLYTGETFDLVRCRQCQLHFINPRPKPEDIAGYYGTDYFAHRAPKVRIKWWQRRIAAPNQPPLSVLMRAFAYVRQSIVWQPVPRYHGEGRVLDIGCGGGKWLDVMSALDWKTAGVEPAQSGADRANAKGHNVACATAEQRVHDDGAFDVVTLWHVLEHTHSPRTCLENIHRYLAPGGRFNVCVPNYRSFHSRLFGRFWWSTDAPRHLFQFDRKTLTRYLQETGFRDIKMTTRTGASSWVRGVRHTINGIFGTKFKTDPAWALALAEIPCFVSSLFRFFGTGSELRASCTKDSRQV